MAKRRKPPTLLEQIPVLTEADRSKSAAPQDSQAAVVEDILQRCLPQFRQIIRQELQHSHRNNGYKKLPS